MESIGARIKRAREDKRMTQGDLGKLCGTTKQTIFKYESGIITNIPMDKIETIAAALEIAPIDLLGWASSTPPLPKKGNRGGIDDEIMAIVHQLSPSEKMQLLSILKSGDTREAESSQAPEGF